MSWIGTDVVSLYARLFDPLFSREILRILYIAHQCTELYVNSFSKKLMLLKLLNSTQYNNELILDWTMQDAQAVVLISW